MLNGWVKQKRLYLSIFFLETSEKGYEVDVKRFQNIVKKEGNLMTVRELRKIGTQQRRNLSLCSTG